ncbi:MAG: ROK family protein [Chloroflexota bacterium]
MKMYGGIEAGGTKFVCAVGSDPDNIRAEARFSTSSPAETVSQAVAFFREQHRINPLAGIGIASFGPVDPNPKSKTFGYITNTPKPGWANTNLVGMIKDALDLPVGFDSDVNGAALGEYRWGAGQGIDTFVYLTVGTGIGGGAVVNGKLAHGLIHPEMGHILIPHAWDADPYAGNCPYHGDCLEGLACGPAIEERWQYPPRQLPPGHPSWKLEAHYLALGLINIILILSPQRIIMGGGVMSQHHLFPLIHRQVQAQMNGYVNHPSLLDDIESYIVPPGLGDRAGVMGAIALAQDVAAEAEHDTASTHKNLPPSGFMLNDNDTDDELIY